MPLMHCNICYGEWEGKKDSSCYACGAGGYVLKEQTEHEKMMESVFELVKEIDGHIKETGVHPLCSNILPD